MLPLHRKEKLDDAKQNSFPYRFAKPAMFNARQRARFAPRQIHIAGFILASFLLWLIFHGGDKATRYKSPYAVNSRYMGPDDVVPILDVTIQECTRWRWFETRSKCAKLLREGWTVSGGDLLLDTGKHRTHLFIKRAVPGKTNPVITDIQVSKEHPSKQGSWEARPGGIWITRRLVSDVHEAVTAIDFVHGSNVRELRRGRNFAKGGYLLLGKDINLSFRTGRPGAREYPRLKIVDTKPYKVLQVAGTSHPMNY
jgi:hypothetical protein